MSRVLIILPSGSYKAEDFLAAARRLGTEVIVATDQPVATGGLAQAGVLHLDCSDTQAATEAIIQLDASRPLDAVIAADDQGVVIAATACEALGLAHNSPVAAAATRDKALLRKALSEAEVDQPDWELLGESDDIDAAFATLGSKPCVIKPRSLSASRGVIRADTLPQAQAALQYGRSIAHAGGSPAMMIESYVPGKEVAVEGLLKDGMLQVLAMFDKPDPLEGPYFEETIYVSPSRLPADIQEQIIQVTQKACAAIGLVQGPVHAELRADGDRVWCIEVAGRSIGGHCSRMLRFGSGASLEELVLRQSLQMPLETPKRVSASGVMMLPIARAGIYKGIRGREDALAVQGIVGLDVSIPVGASVLPVPESDRYLGFLFAKAMTPQFVETSLRSAFQKLEILIDPPDGLGSGDALD